MSTTKKERNDFILKFDCNVKVVEGLPGSGKTSAAINYINSSGDDEKFIFITPYITETERVLEACPKKHFKQPQHTKNRKLNGIKDLIDKGENIVSTHALFRKFDLEAIDLCRAKNYTLILDEVTDVVETYELSKVDFDILLDRFVDIDEETGFLKWRDPSDTYHGKFAEEKRLCELNSLAYYGGSIMMWLFPIEIFNAFRNIYILTYMFNAQMQRYYYDYYHLPYEYIHVEGNNKEEFRFSNSIVEKPQNSHDYRNLIHILEEEKLNLIGDRENALSKTWYDRNKNNTTMKQLKNNILNFYVHKCQTKTKYNMWTTFKEYKSLLSGKGYGRGFVPLNARARNDLAHKTSVVYPINKYINPCIKSFFTKHQVEVDEDGYALSEMLQYIWRSAIRNGEEINVYVPSVRMRRLLKQWIEENSVSA